MASSEPGSATHSSGDLMNASESTLITPSRSRMTTFLVGMACGSGGEPGNVRDAIHLLMQRAEQGQAVCTQRRIFRIDHHVVKESVDRFAQCGERSQRARVVACGELRLHTRRDLFELRMQRFFRCFN